MDNPKVLVLMPAFNAERYVSTAIESILNQTLTDFEFIIIDDGSVDATWEIIQNYARKDTRMIALQNSQNLGICKTLNRGLKTASGKYLARMDADDWSYPDRLQEQINFMEAHPEVVICGGQIEVCDENLRTLNKRKYPQKDNEIREKIFRLNPFAHPAVMMLTGAVKKAGGYNPRLSGVEDYDLYFRLGRIGKFGNISQTILKLRTHSGSVSHQQIGRQSWLNLYVRLKALAEYGYPMATLDKIFFISNIVSVLMIPTQLKFKLYNLLRT